MPGVSERVFPAAPRTGAAAANLTQQAAFYTDGADNLRIMSACAVANVTIVLSGRYQAPDGTIVPFVHEQRANSDRSVKTTDVALAPGHILNVTAVAIGASVSIGNCFVIVQIIRGLSGNTIVLGTLLQGYVTTTQHLAWPGSPITTSTDGTPPVFVATIANPAVNTDWFVQVPVGATWEMLTVHARLTCGATGIPRTVRFYGWYPGQYTLITPPNANQGDTLSFTYTWGQGLAMAGGGGGVAMSAPLVTGWRLPATGSCGPITDGIGGGDQWSEIRIVYREWLEVP